MMYRIRGGVVTSRIAKFVTFAVLPLLSLIAPTHAESDLSFELRTDRPGRDFANFHLEAGARECRQRCLDTSRCKAWTYVGRDAPDGPGHCWLKDAIPDAQPMETAVSGVVGLRLAVDHWAETRRVASDSDWVGLIVRTGDVDNFGFGWPRDFDPFQGRPTSPHRYPFGPEKDDPQGTDRIMVGSGYDGNPPRGEDGYTELTSRPGNRPMPIRIEFPDDGPETERALLQLFVDDFQASRWGAHYRVHLDGERMPGMELAINSLEQTGPIGKLISLPVLPAYHRLLEDGVIELLIDDPETGAGDGFAVDFARLLVNPTRFPDSVAIEGQVVHAETSEPLADVLVTSALSSIVTGADGHFRLKGLPAGLAVVRAGKDGFQSVARTADLFAGEKSRLDFRLSPARGSRSEMAQDLATSGRTRIQGIYFDLDSAKLKAQSVGALQDVLALIEASGSARFRIEGHTDSRGESSYNRELSRRRAQSVVDWLNARGVERTKLVSEGFGEARPIENNETAAGRALNRRVEIVSIDQ